MTLLISVMIRIVSVDLSVSKVEIIVNTIDRCKYYRFRIWSHFHLMIVGTKDL